MSEPLAHSARPDNGIVAQSYRAHVGAVRQGATENMRAALRYYSGSGSWLTTFAEWAGAFHDLGKLEGENQRVLRGEVRARKLPVNHVDAGVAHLRAKSLMEAAIAVYSHHVGLCDVPEEMAKEQRGREAPDSAALRDPVVRQQTDASCPTLVADHHLHAGMDPEVLPGKSPHLLGLGRRLLLSCLVDADHGDTARHAGDERETVAVDPRWGLRRAALDRYVDGLGGGDSTRAATRRQVYEQCRSSEASEPLISCESPVGTGKTTAVMAYLLRVAEEMSLRHIFVVLPYTNIIDQAVEVYRNALVLPGEDPEQVVAAHHHQAEFSSWEARHLTTLWRAPVIVTTAVQFFETLAAAATPPLRKLHELPGSAVFIDEAHAAMRIELWPYMWRQLKELGTDWGCRFVLGSGSLVRFWESERIMDGQPERIPGLIPGEGMKLAEEAERTRIQYKTRTDALNLESLCNWVGEVRGPRVIVLNTVHSAAVVARELKERGLKVEHLSTALAPVDRRRIMKRVRERLINEPEGEFILAATSCVEAGVDLSFATGFRERSRTASLIQLGGRVNRHGERRTGTVWDFVCGDERLKIHPEFTHSRPVVEEVFKNDRWKMSPGDVATYALDEEFKRSSGDEQIKELLSSENTGQYPKVARLARLIRTDTRLVIVDEGVAERVRQGVAQAREIREQSVQLWGYQVRSLALEELVPESGMYKWAYAYESEFLGVMRGILGLKTIDRAGFTLI